MSGWVDDHDYGAAVVRMIRAYGRRIEGADPEHLPMLAELRDEIEAAIAGAVVAMRDRGVTWAEIGEAFGTSPQAAHKRWTTTSEKEPA